MTYSEKLKDPRWQKKRLEIMERDEFYCHNCGNHEMTLHVHHIAYSDGEPWDIENELLITLCELCHENETIEIKNSAKELISTLKSKGFMAWHFSNLIEYISDLSKDEILEYLGKCEYKSK